MTAKRARRAGSGTTNDLLRSEGGLFWATYAAVYDSIWDTDHTASVGRRLVNLVAPSDKDRVVDLACGTGLYSQHLRGRGRVVIGVDRAGAMVRRAQGQDRVDCTVVADAACTGLPSGQTDIVILGNLLHLVPDPAAILREAIRLCANDRPAHIACILPTSDTSPARLAAAERAAGRTRTSILKAQFLRSHVALLADVTGQARRPRWALIGEALDEVRDRGWNLLHDDVVGDCQRVILFSRPAP